MVTLISDRGEHELADTAPSGEALWLTPPALERSLGWSLKPEGLCQGAVCVPLAGKAASLKQGERIDAAGFWRHLDRPVAHDRAGTVWAFGAGAEDRRTKLATLEAPDFSLPDLAGRQHRLADHRGRKVYLATWASW
ncbi:MAG: hypothetical protein HYR63_09765 [Proteobacteria bacterium]|nr:hypothetical protein [Pseudomonadota bacterium]